MKQRFAREYKYLFAVVIATAILLRLLSDPAASLSYMVIAVYALFGRAQAVQALALSWLLTMMNPGLAPEASYASALRYVVIAAAAASVFFRSNFLRRFKPANRMVSATVLLGGFIVGHSYFFSPMFGVSALKALSWTVVMSTLFAAWSGLTPQGQDSLIRELFLGLVLVLLVSLPLLLVPSIGYLRNGTGFQGILNHPQVFGSTVALLGAWAASLLYANKKPPWPSVMLVVACLVLVVLSEARTAGVAMVIGTGTAMVSAPALAKRPILSMLPGLHSKRTHIVIGLALTCFLLAGPMLSEIVSAYIAKRTGASNIVAAYERSRGTLMEEMWYNIQDKPLQGIGFGIASVPGLMDVERDPVFNLPVSASVEKGVMPLAVLEELGILGFLAVAAWIWAIFRRSAYAGVGPLAVTMTSLLINMGESIFFSPGGMGMFVLVLVGWAGSKGVPTSQPAIGRRSKRPVMVSSKTRFL